jgi:hypothetical protein
MFPGTNYILLGHGCDILDKEGNLVVVDIQPYKNKCAYINTTSCGLPAGSEVWSETIYNLQTNAQTTLFDEVQKKKNLYHISDGIIKKDFIDNKFTPMVDVNDSDNHVFEIARSGMIPLNHNNLTQEQTENIVFSPFDDYYATLFFYYDPKTNQTQRSDIEGQIYDDKPIETMIKMAYNGSVYPSVEQVIGIFHNYPPIDEETNIVKKKELFIAFKKEVRETFKISISNLFKLFPGTYFYTACRVICGTADDNNPAESVLLRRAKSFGDDSFGGKKRKRERKSTKKNKRRSRRKYRTTKTKTRRRHH